MALDQNITPAAPEATRVEIIENEIPAYRAISPVAVISLIFGFLSLLAFADFAFLLCAVLAILLGVLADRKVRRFPDVFTGRGLAQAGIALGLIFGLSAVTTGAIQYGLRQFAVTRFAKNYVKVLKTRQLEDAFWYTRPPEARKDKSPSELFQDLKAQVREPHMLEMQLAEIKGLKKRIDGPGQEVHFSKIETLGDEGLFVIATALLDLDGPSTKEFPEKEMYALLTLKADTRKSKYEWWVESIRFPYKPSSYIPQPKPVDDGHGHAH